MTNAQKTTRPGAAAAPKDAEDEAMSSHPTYAGTPGAAYVDTYLLNAGRMDGGEWIVESINRSELRACSRCHFLSLPQRPFPLGEVHVRNAEKYGYTLREDNCDICAFLPEAYFLHLVPCDLSEALDTAGDALAEARLARANTLYRLYMEQADGAEALLWAMLADAREDALRLGITEPQNE